MCVLIKSPIKFFREVFLALVTVFFITAIHAVMDPITKPSHRDAVRLVSAPKLIFFTLCHTVHLWEHTHELWVSGWEQQQLLYAARREQPLMETAPEPCLGFDFEERNLCTPKPVHRAQKHTDIWQYSEDARKLFVFKIIWRSNKFTKNPKSPEMCQVPHQTHQHSPAPRCISKMLRCSLHLHTRTHLKSRLEMLVINTHFSIKKKTIYEYIHL